MVEYDFGYLEGDQLGGVRDLGLLKRLWPFIRPRMRLVWSSLLLILVLIALDLAMPYVTRLAIDRHLVPHYLRLEAIGLSTTLRRKLATALARPEQTADLRWVSTRRWRELDPSLTARLRRSGTVDDGDWYRAGRTPRAQALAGAHPGWFQAEAGYLYVPVRRLKDLSYSELKVLRGGDAWRLGLWALAFAVLAGLALMVSYFQTMALERAGQGMVLDLRMALYHGILDRPLTFFNRNPVGKLVTRTNHDIQNISELFRGLLVGLFRDVLLLFGVAGVMLALDWRLALLCLGLAPLVARLAWRLSFLARDIFRRVQGLVGRINTLLGEMVSGIGQVKLLGAQPPLLARLGRLNRDHFRAGMSQVKLFAVFPALIEFLGALAVALIIWQGGGWVIQDQISLGTMVAFIAYFNIFLGPIRALAENYHLLQGALASAERIMVLMDDAGAKGESGAKPAPSASATTRGADNRCLEFQAVRFGYRLGKPIFPRLDLAIPAGQSVALVGPSGGGKSTLVNLVLRLYEPWSGQILFGGRRLQEIGSEELTRMVALVSQETILVRGSLARNITLGREGIDRARLQTALGISGAAGWVEGLPQGLDTPVGQGGRQLSQGQRQMVALARALAGDPRLLILDEAFSHVDPASERIIHQALPAIMAGRTTLLVAHRLSTAERADRILVMKDGRLVEDGNHQALIKAGGLYADMAGLEMLDSTGTPAR